MTKEERKKRWASGEGYNRYITSELNSFRKNAWKKQLGQHFGEQKGLKILDVGTGPGFFACILSEEGHQVTAIDSSEGMLEKARENARKLEVCPTFLQMDVNDLDFPDGTFDVIVTRNVVWTLEHPLEVYANFRRMLKETGILLVYDANWHLHYFDEEKMKKVRRREQQHLEKYGQKEVVGDDDMDYYMTAPLTSTVRPAWDVQALESMGMKVRVKEDVGAILYEEWEKELYAESPLFEVCATIGA